MTADTATAATTTPATTAPATTGTPATATSPAPDAPVHPAARPAAGAAPGAARPLSARAVDGTGARTEEAAGVITGARERIDALDDRIIGLVQERMAVSAVIQESRIASGGRRVNLSRETAVLTHYSDALGKPGTALAMTLLELCRGRV